MNPEPSTIEQWRVYRGLSKSDLVRKTKLARQTIYDAIANGIANPSTMKELAQAMDISVAELHQNPPKRDLKHSLDLDVADTFHVYKAESQVFLMVPLFEKIMSQGFKNSVQRGEYPVLSKLLPHNEIVTVSLLDDDVAGYFSGDILLVDPTKTKVRSGDLVIASVEGSEGKLYRALRHHGSMVLTRDNTRAPLIRGGWTILGIVIDLVHREGTRL